MRAPLHDGAPQEFAENQIYDGQERSPTTLWVELLEAHVVSFERRKYHDGTVMRTMLTDDLLLQSPRQLAQDALAQVVPRSGLDNLQVQLQAISRISYDT